MRSNVRRMALISRAATSLRIQAAVELWSTTTHAVALPEWRHNWRTMQCECKTRAHRRKDCDMDNTAGCSLCGATFNKTGGLLQYCAGCLDWWETRHQYLGEWALANQPLRPGQMRLDMSTFDFSEVPIQERPFLTDSPAFHKALTIVKVNPSATEPAVAGSPTQKGTEQTQ